MDISPHIGSLLLDPLPLLLFFLKLSFDFAVHFFFLCPQSLQCSRKIQFTVSCHIIIRGIVLKFCRKSLTGLRMKLPDKKGILIIRGGKSHQDHLQIPILHRELLSIIFTEQNCSLRIFVKVPFQTEMLPSTLKGHCSRIVIRIFPGLIPAECVIHCCPSSCALQTKQHCPDKRMECRLAGLIFPINQVNAFTGNHFFLMQFPKILYFKLPNLHACPLLVSSNAHTPSQRASYSTSSSMLSAKLSIYLPMRLSSFFLRSLSKS